MIILDRWKALALVKKGSIVEHQAGDGERCSLLLCKGGVGLLYPSGFTQLTLQKLKLVVGASPS